MGERAGEGKQGGRERRERLGSLGLLDTPTHTLLHPSFLHPCLKQWVAT